MNDALRLKAAHEARLAALDVFLAEFEAEHGLITEADIEAAERRARGRAVVVRGGPSPSVPRTKRTTRRTETRVPGSGAGAA